MPPAPRTEWISYGPRLVPALSMGFSQRDSDGVGQSNVPALTSFLVRPTLALSRAAWHHDNTGTRRRLQRMLGRLFRLSQFQERHFGFSVEPPEFVHAVPQQPSHVGSCAVAHAKPHDLGRRPTQDAETMKILVLGHEHAAVLLSQLPNGGVTGSALAKETNVQGIGEEIAQHRHQLFGQLFVEEQAHGSGGRNTLCAALALSGVRQARPDVFPGELREIAEDMIL